MWVRNVKGSAKVIAKDASSTKRVRHARAKTCAEITRLLFEILLLCLRRAWLERNSTQKPSKSKEIPSHIDPKSTKNRSWAVLAAQGSFRNTSRRAWDGFWTPTCRPKADPRAPQARQERPRVAQERPRAAKNSPRAAKSGLRAAKSGPRAANQRQKVANIVLFRLFFVC